MLAARGVRRRELKGQKPPEMPNILGASSLVLCRIDQSPSEHHVVAVQTDHILCKEVSLAVILLFRCHGQDAGAGHCH